jgi:dihydroorotase
MNTITVTTQMLVINGKAVLVGTPKEVAKKVMKRKKFMQELVDLGCMVQAQYDRIVGTYQIIDIE